MAQEVRVRIAPSPTGDPHVGTAYIALFNYIFAKKHNGKFVLRIEDTDQARAKSTSEGMISESMGWLGLRWDEGPDVGGPYGPYRQSERTEIYRQHIDILLKNGTAYPCFCTTERLDQLRAEQRAAGKTTAYDRLCRDLPEVDVKSKMAQKIPYVVRLKMPADGMTEFHDQLRGKVEIDNQRLDDQVLIKADGFPTYHFANVVDDHAMKITHVIRAEEWISSTPKHVILYKSFGWAEPQWIHMPLLRNTDKSKISKRKNPVSLNYYRRAGILPETLLNFLGLMGWSYGEDREIFSMTEMMERFSFDRVSLGGPVFDLQKLAWLNQQYLQKMSEDSFVQYMRKEVFSESYLKQLRPLLVERISKFEEFIEKGSFFFTGAIDYTLVPVIPQGKTKDDVRPVISDLVEKLDELYEWEPTKIHDVLDAHKTAIGWKPKDYFLMIRYITTGRKDSPPLNETLAVLGREMVRFRLRDVLSSQVLK
jgi:glutamyl-tRNA synthetase